MITLKLRKQKIASVLTYYYKSLDIPTETQEESISSLARFPKVYVSGTNCPVVMDGVRQVKADGTLLSLLSHYVGSMPGSEVCILTPPKVIVTGDPQRLMDYVQAEKIELAWACRMGESFIMTLPVAAHMMQAVGSMTVNDDWVTWTDAWMKRLMDHRYFNGNPFSFLRQLNYTLEPVVNGNVVTGESSMGIEVAKPKKKIRKVRA